MSVKFKIGMTISAETLFGILAKFLPVEHLHIEEVVDHPVPPPTPAWAQSLKLNKPKLPLLRKTPKSPKKKRKASIPMSLTKGINAIIMAELAHGMARYVNDLKPALIKGGYSGNSAGSRLNRLLEHGVVENMGDGTWRLASKHVPSAT